LHRGKPTFQGTNYWYATTQYFEIASSFHLETYLAFLNMLQAKFICDGRINPQRSQLINKFVDNTKAYIHPLAPNVLRISGSSMKRYPLTGLNLRDEH